MKFKNFQRETGNFLRNIFYPALLLTSLYSFSSCSGSSPVVPSTPSNPPKSYAYEDNVKKPKNVLVYNENLGQIVFSNSSEIKEQNIKKEDILISGITPSAPRGFLRRVTSINDNKINTAPANLNDAFKFLDVKSEFSLNPESKQFKGNDAYAFAVPIDAVLFDRDGNPNTTDDQSTLKGQINFNFKVDNFHIKADLSGFKEFELETSSSESFVLDFNSKVSPPFFSRKIQVSPDIYCTPIPAGPIVLVPTIDVYVSFNGSLSNFDLSVVQFSNFFTGAYFDGSSWGTSSNFVGNASVRSSIFSSSLDANVSVGPEVSLMVYTLAGASLGADASLEAKVSPHEDPWWSVYGGLEAKLGAKIKLLGWNVADWSKTIIDSKKLIAKSQDPPVIAHLTASPKSGSAPLEVLLDASSSTPKEGIQSYCFYFGDGTPNYYEEEGNAPDGIFDGKTTHTYTLAGHFTPQVTVTGNSYERQDKASTDVYVSSSQGKIVFTSVRGSSDAGVYSINPDGTGEHVIIDTYDTWEIASSVSPENNFVLFSSKIPFTSDKNDIYKISYNGTNKTQLTDTPDIEETSAVFSPDGSQIAYIRNVNPDEIWVMDSNGGNPHKIFSSQGKYI